MKIKATVYCDCGSLITQYEDDSFLKVQEKYPFYCTDNDHDIRMDKWPWFMEIEVVE